MAGGSSGYRAGLVRRQRTPGLTSLLPGTAGLPPFISFSISYPELDSAVRGPAASYVCFWHLADMLPAPTNVRFWGQSGPSPITISMSAFDPKRTSTSPLLKRRYRDILLIDTFNVRRHVGYKANTVARAFAAQQPHLLIGL
jgi:hypothetical protein